MIRIKPLRSRLILAIILAGVSALFYLAAPLFNRSKQPSHLGTRGPFFVPVKICEYATGDIPCISIRAENKSAIVQLDLGYSSGISLTADFLQDLNRKFIRQRSSYGMRGKKYQNDVYELPGIKIGDLTIAPVLANETNLEFEKDTILVEEEPTDLNLGRIGWRLFYNFNLFLDCENDLLAFCDNLKTLQSKFTFESFTETSLLLDRDLVEFVAMTEKGPLRCVLDTGCTWSLLNKNLDGLSEDHIIFNPENIHQHQMLNPNNEDLSVFQQDDFYEVSDFKIGGKNFGPFTFRQIKVPAQVDAILGMDFLLSTPLFIDFSERKIYFLEILDSSKTLKCDLDWSRLC